MDSSEIKEIENAVNMLIMSAVKDDGLGRCASSLQVSVIGAPALNYLTRNLEIALRERDSPVVIALSMAITDIWELNGKSPLVSKNKEKMRTLISRCPRILPEIDLVLHDLRQALKPGASTHASEVFLRGPRPKHENMCAAMDKQKNVLRIPVCKN